MKEFIVVILGMLILAVLFICMPMSSHDYEQCKEYQESKQSEHSFTVEENNDTIIIKIIK